MPWIRSFRHLGIWVAFTESEWYEISSMSFGLTQNHAEVRCLRKIDRRPEKKEESK